MWIVLVFLRKKKPDFTQKWARNLRTSPPLTEVSRALRARNAEKVSKMSPGASGPRTPKSLQKVSGTVRKISGECRKSLFGLFPRLFGDFSGSRGRRPRQTFSRLFRHFGKGPRDLCKGRARSQREIHMNFLFWPFLWLGLPGRLLGHHQCWEVLPFCRFQRQRCIKILCPGDPDFYTPLVLKTAKGQHLPALVVYKSQSPIFD